MKRFVFVAGAIASSFLALAACSDSATNGSSGDADAASGIDGETADTSKPDTSKAEDAGSDTGTPAVLVSAPTSLNTGEDLSSTTFTVALATAPTADVTISVTVDKAAEASSDKASLTFTASNYATPQVVTITGVDDAFDDGDVAYNVVFGAATSTDPAYAGKKPASIKLTNLDNDVPGIAVSAVTPATTTEKGGTATFKVRLRSAPTADVTIAVVSSKVAEGTVDTASLTFTTASYATEQTVTITGVNDDLPDGDQAYSIDLGKSTSADPKYANLEAQVALSNTDDDAVVGLQAAWSNYCAVFVDGRMKCWGRNEASLGLGDMAHRGDGPGEMGDALPFLDFGAGRTVKAAAQGNRGDVYQCALLDNGSVKCWGTNFDGQLGQGDTTVRGGLPNQMGDNLLPVDLGAGRTAKHLSTAFSRVCAVLDDNTVKCWGANYSGGLGLGDTARRGATPNTMGDALSTVPLGAGRTAKSVAAGGTHNCALLDNDTVKCWGDNAFGQLGQGDTVARGDNPNELGDNLPAIDFGAGRTVKAVEVGELQSCVLLDNDTVKCWGDNVQGRLGLGDTLTRGDNPNEMGDNLPALDFGAGRTVKKLSVGNTESCVILDNDALKCWGFGGLGQLGQGNTANRGDNANEMGDNLAPIDLGAGRIARSVRAGTNSACAILDNGAVKCWGYSSAWGTLGLGDLVNRGDNPNEMGDNLPAVKLIGP